ncbi:hypothetical protein CEXT_713671 [Caerostris extrusa]|uniref:Uncharacterized protein n=1 Tax=Caerostris extrusa TaxID=172846 RepID=A0AAV4MYE6_CAEEX|nr:hypothetical protein CEXT_713671 [Caerostris extrusa]
MGRLAPGHYINNEPSSHAFRSPIPDSFPDSFIPGNWESFGVLSQGTNDSSCISNTHHVPRLVADDRKGVYRFEFVCRVRKINSDTKT